MRQKGGMTVDKEKIEYYAHLTITFFGALLVGYIFIRYLFFIALPFLLSWGVAFSLRAPSKRIGEATHIPSKVISLTLTLLIIFGGVALVVSAVVFAATEAWDFLTELLGDGELYGVLEKIMNPISGILGDREGAAELEARIGEAIREALSSLLSSLVGIISSFAKSVPRALVFFLVTVVSSVYFSLDLDKINGFVKRLLPKSAATGIVRFKDKFLSVLVKYLRAYLIIALFTFITMLFGFLVLGVKYAVLFAFVVSLLDALPLIGVGTVLVPFSIYEILFGRLGLGIGLVILFVSHALMRQFIEPKIVGKSLGIHPIVSLVLLYAGYFLLGFFGLLLVPIFAVVINILAARESNSRSYD